MPPELSDVRFWDLRKESESVNGAIPFFCRATEEEFVALFFLIRTFLVQT